jgi:hypothetical protein
MSMRIRVGARGERAARSRMRSGCAIRSCCMACCLMMDEEMVLGTRARGRRSVRYLRARMAHQKGV